jgi:endonuclease III
VVQIIVFILPGLHLELADTIVFVFALIGTETLSHALQPAVNTTTTAHLSAQTTTESIVPATPELIDVLIPFAQETMLTSPLYQIEIIKQVGLYWELGITIWNHGAIGIS